MISPETNGAVVRTSGERWLMLASTLQVAWQVSFYLVPITWLVTISFWTMRAYQLQPAFQLSNYAEVLHSGIYLAALRSSLYLASAVSIIAVAAALPAALAIVNTIPTRLARLVVAALFIPFFSNYVVRMFCWQLLLANDGIGAAFLRSLGIRIGPINVLYTPAAVILGLLSITIPISILVMEVGLRKIDPLYYDAARNLGASDLQRFRYITLPFIWPAMIISCLIAFLFAFGDFVCMSVLGGNTTYTLTTAMIDQVKISDWPLASAIGSLILAVSLTVASLALVLLRRTGIGHYRIGDATPR